MGRSLCPTVGGPSLQPEASQATFLLGRALPMAKSSLLFNGGRECRVETWPLFSSCVTQGKLLDLLHPHLPYL